MPELEEDYKFDFDKMFIDREKDRTIHVNIIGESHIGKTTIARLIYKVLYEHDIKCRTKTVDHVLGVSSTLHNKKLEAIRKKSNVLIETITHRKLPSSKQIDPKNKMRFISKWGINETSYSR